jgi:hypothetical protein
MEGDDCGDAPLADRQHTRQTVVRVHEVEAATTKCASEHESGFDVGSPSLTAIEGEHFDVYAQRAHVLD